MKMTQFNSTFFLFTSPSLINKIFPLSTKGFFVTQRHIVCELKNEKNDCTTEQNDND